MTEFFWVLEGSESLQEDSWCHRDWVRTKFKAKTGQGIMKRPFLVSQPSSIPYVHGWLPVGRARVTVKQAGMQTDSAAAWPPTYRGTWLTLNYSNLKVRSLILPGSGCLHNPESSWNQMSDVLWMRFDGELEKITLSAQGNSTFQIHMLT